MTSSTPSQISFPAVCLRLWLAVLLWHVPVPWGHEHCPGVSESIEHMVRFHPGDVQKWQQGWHWHWSFPDQVPGNSGRSETPLPGTAPTVNTVLNADGLPDWLMPTHVPAGHTTFLPPVRKRFAPVAVTGAASEFLASFCPAHSPQQVLCRRSC